MQTHALFGGRPNVAIRATYAVVAALALAIAIWELPANDAETYLGHDAVQVIHIVTMLVIAAISAAQAVAPVRFAWPGWILLATVLFPASSGSFAWALDSLTMDMSYGPPTSLFIRWLLLPAFYSLALFAALLAWHLSPTDAPARRPVAGPELDRSLNG